MKKNISQKIIVLVGSLIFAFLSSCASTGNSNSVDNEESVSAFGMVEIVLSNYSIESLNKTYRDELSICLLDNVTKKRRYIPVDEDGFFYIDKLKKFNNYTIEKYEFHPDPAYPDSTWTWNWTRDFSVSYEETMNLGATTFYWKVGENSSQERDFEKSIPVYEKKCNAVYERPVFKGPDDYAHVEKYRDGKPNLEIARFIELKDIKKLQKKNPEKYIKIVSEKINELASNDFEKARFAHDVVALILEYDAKNYWAGKIPNQDYKSVLKTGKSVCAGYASVYKAFCDELHLPCIVVDGWAKGVSFNPKATKFETNHDWNIVLIDGCWYLMDCTWDSGYMQGKENVQSYGTRYLFVKPEHIIYSHYPDNRDYQLLEKPFTDKDILFVPNLKPEHFDGKYNVKIEVESFDSEKGEITFLFTHKGTMDFYITQGQSNRRLNSYCKVTKTESGSRVEISIPENGVYNISFICDGWTFNNWFTLNVF